MQRTIDSFLTPAKKAGPESDIDIPSCNSNTRRLNTCGQPIGCVEGGGVRSGLRDCSGVVKWVVTHVKVVYGSKQQMARERCSLPPMSLSAPSCNAGVYAHCRLKTIETGDDRPLVVLWVTQKSHVTNF